MRIEACVEISAVPFRPLNSFEWAVLCLLKEFAPAPPSLEDATKQLHLQESAFLTAGFESMLKVGAVASRTGDALPNALESSALTEHGREILQHNGWEIAKEEHLNRTLVLDWPSGRVLLPAEASRAKINKSHNVTAQQIEDRLSREDLESWLNTAPDSIWKVKSFYVTGE